MGGVFGASGASLVVTVIECVCDIPAIGDWNLSPFSESESDELKSSVVADLLEAFAVSEPPACPSDCCRSANAGSLVA